VGAVAASIATYAMASPRSLAARLPRLRVLSVAPANHATSVSGTAPIVIRFNQPIAKTSPMPTLLPALPGRWHRVGKTLQFVPRGAYNPDSVVGIFLAGRASGVRGANGAFLATSSSYSFHVEQGSLLRAEQLLARLGYLPLQFVPSTTWALSPADYALAVFSPPPGRFAWRFTPEATLATQWSPGIATTMFAGAVMSFESHNQLPVDGQLSWPLWQALLADVRSLSANYARGGYAYALASKTLPETLNVFSDGRLVLHTLANTGISLSATTDGTYPVFLRYQNQTMQGVDPWGHHYSDPVSWMAYFDGNQAVHYFDRASYGFPQSLGCVEVPYQAAKAAWPYLQIGTLVTVAG
jgi:hypothetical protein